MILEIHATEELCVRIVIDDDEPREYLFSAAHKHVWKGKDKFLLLLGNAGQWRLKLNREQLGKPGAVAQNVLTAKEGEQR